MRRSITFCSCVVVATGIFSPLRAQAPLTPPDWTYQSNQAGAGLGTWVARAGDVNGDGFADVLVSAPGYDGASTNAGLVLLFLGSPSGLASTPAWSVSGSGSQAQLTAPEMAGDVNGDGFDDILLKDGRLFFGSASGVSTASQSTGIPATYGFSSADADGDGYDDVAVGLEVWYGSPSGLSRNASWKKSIKGASSTILGDLTGDGYAELVLGTFNKTQEDIRNGFEGSGRLQMFLGGPAGLSKREAAVPDVSYVSASPFLRKAGDVDGDGFDDFLLGLFGDLSLTGGQPRHFSSLSFLRGSAGGFLAPSPSSFYNSGGRPLNEMDGDVDVNGDGYDEILIHEGDRLLLLAGSPNGPTAAVAVLSGLDSTTPLLSRLARGVGDVNGDGYDDLVVGFPGFSDGEAGEGRVALFLGRPEWVPAATETPTAR